MREFRNLNWTAITSVAIVMMSLQSACGEQPKPADADIAATVSMLDGTVFKLSAVTLKSSAHLGPGEGVAFVRDSSIGFLPLLIGLTMLEIPFDKIAEVVLPENQEKKKEWSPGGPVATVTLLDGHKLNGSVDTPFGEAGFLRAITGRVTVAGYPAKLRCPIYDISKIEFVHAGDTITATITATNGQVTDKVSGFELAIDGGPIQVGWWKEAHFELEIGNTKLEVPVSDVEAIEREKDQSLLVVHNGSKLKGSIKTDFVCGRTTVAGFPADSRIPFGDIRSIVFNKIGTVKQEKK